MSFEIETPPRKKSLWWLWLLLIGGVFVVTPVACCGGLAFFGFNLVKAPLDAATAALQQNPTVAEKLGTPINYGGGLNVNNFKSENGNGSAEIDTNYSGPNSSARVQGTMKQTAGAWSVDHLTVTFADGEVLEIP